MDDGLVEVGSLCARRDPLSNEVGETAFFDATAHEGKVLLLLRRRGVDSATIEVTTHLSCSPSMGMTYFRVQSSPYDGVEIPYQYVAVKQVVGFTPESAAEPRTYETAQGDVGSDAFLLVHDVNFHRAAIESEDGSAGVEPLPMVK